MSRVIVYMLFFLVYTFVLLYWGKSGFKKTNTVKDFYVANNSLAVSMSTATYAVTLFSAVSMQSVSGSVYQYGYSAILYSVVGWLFGSSLVILLVKQIKASKIVTIPEYFRKRYGSKNFQAFTGAVLAICYVFYIIIQIKGFGIVISALLDIDYKVAAMLIYLFILYTGFGGLFSIAKTDILNFVVIIAGIGTVAISLLMHQGDLTELIHNIADIDNGALLSPTSNNTFSPVMIFTTAMAWGLGTAANPQYIIRIVSAKSSETATKMICFSNVSLGFLYFGLIIIGFSIRIQSGELNLPIDEVLAYFIYTGLRPVIGGILFVSVIAAAVSTANSQLLLVASSVSYDVYGNLTNRDVRKDSFLNVNRVIIFIAATASLVLSMQPLDTLLIYGSYVWSVIAVIFLWPLYGGVLWKGATKKGAILSSVVGVISVAVFYSIQNLQPALEDIHPVLPGTAVSFLVFYLVSKFDRLGGKI